MEMSRSFRQSGIGTAQDVPAQLSSAAGDTRIPAEYDTVDVERVDRVTCGSTA